VRYYKLCLERRPGYAQARFMLALAEERCGQREAAIRDYAKAYRHAPELANAAKNPLVFDSDLQLPATMRYYRADDRHDPQGHRARSGRRAPHGGGALPAPPQAAQPRPYRPARAGTERSASQGGATGTGGLGINPAAVPTPKP